MFLARRHSKELSNWKWREKTGHMISPKEMRTRHLFYTLRMIWNHTMPECVRFHPFKKYDFSSFYDTLYMIDAVYHIGTELFTRTDLTDEQKEELKKMAETFNEKSNRLSVENR